MLSRLGIESQFRGGLPARVSRLRISASAIMPIASTKCSQLSALLTGTKFAADCWSMISP